MLRVLLSLPSAAGAIAADAAAKNDRGRVSHALSHEACYPDVAHPGRGRKNKEKRVENEKEVTVENEKGTRRELRMRKRSVRGERFEYSSPWRRFRGRSQKKLPPKAVRAQYLSRQRACPTVAKGKEDGSAAPGCTQDTTFRQKEANDRSNKHETSCSLFCR